MSSDALKSKNFTAMVLMPVSATSADACVAEKKMLYSSSFACPDDPRPTHFKLKIKIVYDDDDEKQISALIGFLDRPVKIVRLKYTMYDTHMNNWEDRVYTTDEDYWSPVYWTLDPGFGDIRVFCEVRYEGIPETSSAELTNCDPLPHRETLSQNMLDLFNDPEDADVTLRVGDKEFKAHKNILVARSLYFRNLFKSGMKESLTKESEFDENPLLFQEMLKFLYSGLVPACIDEVAMDLLPIADKYAVKDLKQLCDTALRRSLSAENVVQVMRLADDHVCPDLFQYCAPIFKARLHDLQQIIWDELENESSKFLAKLLKIASE